VRNATVLAGEAGGHLGYCVVSMFVSVAELFTVSASLYLSMCLRLVHMYNDVWYNNVC